MHWRIGGLDIDGRVVLGPMSGYTSPAYRDFMKPFGVAVSVTEMVSDKGIIYNQRKTEEYVRYPENHPTGVQLFGGDPGEMGLAASKLLKINPNVDFIDINMGCPVAKITRNGGGSALMRDPALCGDIVKAVKKGSGLPVTVKFRLGWSRNEMNFREVMEETVSSGADAVMLHVRTRDEKYAGKAHYELVKDLRREMGVPLVISGNIYCLDDAVSALDVTGAEGVMVARGGVGNPFLVSQIDRFLRTGERLPNPTVKQQAEWCLQFADMLLAEKGDETTVRKMRSYAPRFISGCCHGKEYRNSLATGIRSMDDLMEILGRIVEERGDEVMTDSRGLDNQDF
ncbi:MAG: tRNA pseudouridine synthase B [Thermoplasmata archaeon]|nr:tRNA pseudouridine synthase B [Thermoplasmata archaeon]